MHNPSSPGFLRRLATTILFLATSLLEKWYGVRLAGRYLAATRLSPFQAGSYQKKPRVLVRIMAGILFALLLTTASSLYGQTITTTRVDQNHNLINNDPINICTDDVIVHVVVTGSRELLI